VRLRLRRVGKAAAPRGVVGWCVVGGRRERRPRLAEAECEGGSPDRNCGGLEGAGIAASPRRDGRVAASPRRDSGFAAWGGGVVRGWVAASPRRGKSTTQCAPRARIVRVILILIVIDSPPSLSAGRRSIRRNPSESCSFENPTPITITNTITITEIYSLFMLAAAGFIPVEARLFARVAALPRGVAALPRCGGGDLRGWGSGERR
jgi:hypothetical protein